MSLLNLACWRVGWRACLAGCALAAGCDAAAPLPAVPETAPPATAAPAVRKDADGFLQPDHLYMEQLSTPLPLLDRGRVEFFPPQNWHVLPRESEWLVRLQLERNLQYPSLSLRAVDSPLAELTPATAADFAASIQRALDAELAPLGGSLSQPVQTLRLGDRLWVEHGRRSRVNGQAVERYFLETAAGGRRYTLEFRVPDGSLPIYLPTARGVAAHMRVLLTGQPAGAASDEGE